MRMQHVVQISLVPIAISACICVWVLSAGNVLLGSLGTVLSLGGLSAYFHWYLFQSSYRMKQVGDMNAKINRAILLNEDMESIFDLVLADIFQIFRNVRFGSVLVLDEQGYLTIAANRGFNKEYVDSFHMKLTDSFLYIHSGGRMNETCLISPSTLSGKKTRLEHLSWKYRSVISAPLYRDGQLFGMLNLDSAKRNLFNANDVLLVDQFRIQMEVCLMARTRYEANIQRLNVDALTGLSTRRLFEDLFQLSMERATRYGEEFLLVMFDADGLKGINDRLGHLAGDQYLMAIADTLRGAHRKSDILGRYGGDEFIAVYHNCPKDDMRQTLAALRESCRTKPRPIGNENLPVSFSFGIARYPPDGTSFGELIKAADGELYAMKGKSKKT